MTAPAVSNTLHLASVTLFAICLRMNVAMSSLTTRTLLSTSSTLSIITVSNLAVSLPMEWLWNMKVTTVLRCLTISTAFSTSVAISAAQALSDGMSMAV